jgi:hypothetical protein
MAFVQIDAADITSWESFHNSFKTAFGFPDFYGMNMDAWIDCMSCLDGEFNSFKLETGELLVIEISGTEEFVKQLPEAQTVLAECMAFVNQRFIEDDDKTRIALLFS